MKKLLLFAIIAFVATACKSPDQIAAEECLKRHLKCPSTLKVVEFEVINHDADTIRDTTYHISLINGKKYCRYEKLFNQSQVRNVHVDSVSERVTIYPAHKSCNISYDAQNKMGAMVRESATVIITRNGETMIWRNWIDRNFYNSTTSKWATSLKLGEPSGYKYEYIQCGDWVEARRWKKL